ncbi:MAG: hypothetical protein AVDCRST_MAG67-2577, partial [uncultured Solirubrobacteraceae bacterium]
AECGFWDRGSSHEGDGRGCRRRYVDHAGRRRRRSLGCQRPRSAGRARPAQEDL